MESSVTGLGTALRSSKSAQVGEIAGLATAAFVVVAIGVPLAGDNPLARQMVVWVANVVMIAVVWLGLRLRGQTWKHFGLSFEWRGARPVMRAVLLSLAVFAAAIAAFLIGSVVMANIVGIPESADMSGYNYLEGNLGLLLLALPAVWVVSSFGEEVVYRAFLINRVAELSGGGKVALRWAVVFSAVVFGLVHYDWGWMGIGQTTFMGLALGMAYLIVGRNLWITILAHTYMDTILFVQLYLGGQ